MAAAKTRKLVRIRFLIVQGFISEVYQVAFGFDNAQFTASFDLPRREGTGKQESMGLAGTAQNHAKKS
jgi:hypothetical protein